MGRWSAGSSFATACGVGQPGYCQRGYIRVLDIQGVIHWKPECECEPPDRETDREEIERYFREGKRAPGSVQAL